MPARNVARRPPLIQSPTPPQPPAGESLPTEINVATRAQHTKLNLLIVDRLKLALPPNAHNPRLLGIGLAAFARIYYEFEDAWDHVLRSDYAAAGDHEEELSNWLARLRPAGLPRTSRLEEDVRHISSRTGSKVTRRIPAQEAMLQRMRASIHERPHTLVAYSWVMYMAIFSGGRWIRQQLCDAGSEFWTGTPDVQLLEKQGYPLHSLPGFSFLFFAGDDDGEDTKASFKSRLSEAEALMTHDERHDVVAASIALFEDCIALVEMIDQAVWWDMVSRKLFILGLVGLTALAVAYLVLMPDH